MAGDGKRVDRDEEQRTNNESFTRQRREREEDWFGHGQPAETDVTQKQQRAEPAHHNCAGAKCGERAYGVVIRRSFV